MWIEQTKRTHSEFKEIWMLILLKHLEKSCNTCPVTSGVLFLLIEFCYICMHLLWMHCTGLLSQSHILAFRKIHWKLKMVARFLQLMFIAKHTQKKSAFSCIVHTFSQLQKKSQEFTITEEFLSQLNMLRRLFSSSAAGALTSCHKRKKQSTKSD